MSKVLDKKLLDYVLKTNNKKLNKEFIETIAGQWKRLNIETVSEAMEICRKEHKKINNKPTPTNKTLYPKENTKTPDWFDKEIKVDNKNIEEFDNLLNGF